MSTRRISLRRLGILLALASMVPASLASGALVTQTSSDAFGTSSWSNSNWSNGLPPAAGNDYVVPAGITMRTPNDNDGPTVFGGDSLTIDAGAFLGLKHIGARTVNDLRLNGATVSQSGNGTGTPITIQGNVTLLATSTFSAEAGRTIIVDAPMGGAGGLVMTGAGGGGVLTLSGANSYGGATTVNAGRLRLTNSGALGNSAGVTLNNTAVVGGDGTVLDLQNNIATSAAVPLNMNSNAASNFRTTLMSTSGTNTWGGAIILNGTGLDQLNANGGNLTVNGNITAGGGGFTGTLFVRGGNTGTINGTINMPSGTLGKTDGGTWIVNSSGNVWGATNVAVGTLRMGAAGALPAATLVTMGQGDANNATLDLNGFSQTVGGLALNSTGGTKAITSASSATLTVNNAAASTYGGVLSGAGLVLTKSGAGSLTLSGANTYGGVTTVAQGILLVRHSSALGTTAGDTVVLGADGSTAARIALNPSSGSLDIAENLRLNASAAGRVALRNDAGTNTWSGNIDVTGVANPVMFEVSSGSLTISGDITGNPAGGIHIRGGGGNGIITGSLNIGTVGLAKTDGNSWTIGAAGETYAWGATQVSLGTLKMGADNVMPSSTVLTMGQADGGTAIFDLNGFSQTIAGLQHFSGTTGVKTVTNTGPAAATLTVNNSGNFTYGFTITNGANALHLTKTGAGTLTLSGANTYTGATTIGEGTLILGADNVLPDTTDVSLAVSAAATLNMNSRSDEVRSLRIAGAGTLSNATAAGKFLTLNSTADALIWNAASGITANIRLFGATGGNVVASGFTGAFSYGGTLDLGGQDRVFNIADTNAAGSDLFFTGNITNGGVIKTGPGTLKYDGNMTYTGLTDVQQGFLFIQSGGNRIPDTAPLRVSGGTFQLEVTETLGAVTLASGNLTGAGTLTASSYDLQSGASILKLAGSGGMSKTTAGAVTLSAANPFTGTTTVQQGTLALTGAGSLASSLIEVQANAVLNVTGVTGGQYVLASGQRLRGNGTVLGNLLVGPGANISAGASPGHLTEVGNYTQAGVMLAELGGLVQGTEYDWIEVQGTATLQAGAVIDVDLVNGFAPSISGADYFNILTATGGITNANLTGIVFDFSGADYGGRWAASIVPLGGTAEALRLNAVPEPATLGMLLAGGAAVLWAALRRRKKGR